MLTKQVPNSDILSLLGASAKGAVAGAEGKASSALEGLVGKKLSDFSEVLKSTGSLDDLSGADLLAFFSKKSAAREGNSEAKLSELFSKLQTSQGREILKDLKLEGNTLKNTAGETISLDDLAKSLKVSVKEEVQIPNNLNLAKAAKPQAKSKNIKLQSAHDFLNSKKAMGQNKSITVTENGPKVAVASPAIQQYSKETKFFQKNLIRPLGDKRVEKASLESVGNNADSSSALSQMIDADPMMLTMKTSGQSDAGAQTDSQLLGQMNQTVDLSQVSSQNKTELMQKIGQYIENSYVAGNDSIDLVVKHDELGQFRINAQKSGPGSQVNLEINTVTDHAHQFFVDNEGELMKALNKSGVKVSDFKLANVTESFKTSFGESKSSMEQSFQSGSERSDQNFAGGRSSRQDQGQNKRQRLWQEAKDFSEQLLA